MRQFDFWATFEDTRRIVAAILATGKALAVPPKPYPSPEAKFFAQLDSNLEERLRVQGGVELWLPGVSSVPFAFESWEEGQYAGQYFLSGGGPTLAFARPPFFEADGKHMLNVGHLSCDHAFYNPHTKAELPMPDEARARYDEFVKIIKSLCKRYGDQKRWVGLEAAELLDSGKAKFVTPEFFKEAMRRQQ